MAVAVAVSGIPVDGVGVDDVGDVGDVDGVSTGVEPDPAGEDGAFFLFLREDPMMGPQGKGRVGQR